MKNKLTKIFAVASLAVLAGCAARVPEGQPGHDTRGLTDGEIAMAQEIFGDQMDYKRIGVISHNANHNMALNRLVRMTPRSYAPDYSKEPSIYKRKSFMHELTHQWQEQHGVNLAQSALSLFFRHDGQYDRAYNYRLEDVRDFKKLSIEQQGALVEDYFMARHTIYPLTQADTCARIDAY